MRKIGVFGEYIFLSKVFGEITVNKTLLSKSSHIKERSVSFVLKGCKYINIYTNILKSVRDNVYTPHDTSLCPMCTHKSCQLTKVKLACNKI